MLYAHFDKCEFSLTSSYTLNVIYFVFLDPYRKTVE